MFLIMATQGGSPVPKMNGRYYSLELISTSAHNFSENFSENLIYLILIVK